MKCIVPTLVLADDLVAGSLELSTETEEVLDVELVEFETDRPLHPASNVPQPKQEAKIESPPVLKKEQSNRDDLQCKKCSYSTKRSFNLHRHVLKSHGAEAARSSQDGGCICLTCGYKCFFIKQLRRHLTENHGYVFRTMTEEFKSMEGKVLFVNNPISIFFKLKVKINTK